MHVGPFKGTEINMKYLSWKELPGGERTAAVVDTGGLTTGNKSGDTAAGCLQLFPFSLMG